MLECLFNKVAGLQDCCKTYLLHTHLKFFYSGKTLNIMLNINVKYKVMFTEAYLEPSRTSTMEPFL